MRAGVGGLFVVFVVVKCGLPVWCSAFRILWLVRVLVRIGIVSITSCHYCYILICYFLGFCLVSARARLGNPAPSRSFLRPFGCRVRGVICFVVVACVKGEWCVSGCAEACFYPLGSRLWIRFGGSTLALSASQCSRVAPLLQGRGTLCNDLHSRDRGEGFLLSRTMRCAGCARFDCC